MVTEKKFKVAGYRVKIVAGSYTVNNPIDSKSYKFSKEIHADAGGGWSPDTHHLRVFFIDPATPQPSCYYQRDSSGAWTHIFRPETDLPIIVDLLRNEDTQWVVPLPDNFDELMEEGGGTVHLGAPVRFETTYEPAAEGEA